MERLTKWLGIIAIIVIGVVIGFVCYVHVFLGLSLDNQPGTLRFPPQMVADVTATRALAIQLQGKIHASVPFKQNLTLPLHGIYRANLHLDAHFPLKFVIHYKGDIPIDAKAVIHGTTNLIFHSSLIPHFKLTLPVPLDFLLPVKLAVPVNTNFHLVYNGPVKVAINQNVDASVDTTLHTTLKVNKEVHAPILASFNMLVYPPRTALPIIVKHARLDLPLSSLRLQRRTTHAPANAASERSVETKEE